MPDRSFLDWPFFAAEHRELARDVDAWAREELAAPGPSETDPEAAVISLVRRMGARGWLTRCIERIDVRALCLIRETLARYDGLADVAFAMQGLGSAPISLFGSDALKRRYLPGVASGEHVAAFALSEPDGGSDLAGIVTTARREGGDYVLDGVKTWVSNGGIASHYVILARLADSADPGAAGPRRDFLACIVDADNPGLSIPTRIAVTAPHPLATLRLEGCRIPATQVIGEPGAGMKVALATLDLFRPTVGAAALGFARRALEEALDWVRQRRAFGKLLAEHQLTQARLADMATGIDASALLVYRAAWRKDTGAARISREAAMAKLFATETAQHVVDDAVQLLGGRGVVAGSPVERLYREVRALRIYEGTSEIQKLIIAAQVLEAAP